MVTSAALKMCPVGGARTFSRQLRPFFSEREMMSAPFVSWTVAMTVLPRASSSGQPKESRSVMVRTRSACELAEISYQKLEQLFESDLRSFTKEILYALGRQLTERLAATSQKVSHLAFLDVTGRIAGTLLELCKQPDAMTHPDGMQIRITRQEIGRIVGCSREMAGRVLKDLEERGLIHVKGKTIVVFGTR